MRRVLRIDLANRKNRKRFDRVTAGVCLMGLELLQHDLSLASEVSSREVLRRMGFDVAEADDREVAELRYDCMMLAQEFLIKGLTLRYVTVLEEHEKEAAELGLELRLESGK
jgi:hypothetical protein